MELIFLGRGSAFNIKEGNNSSYFIENNELFLIDCGESIFSKLINNNILQNIKSINILITHTHTDHISSLGDLILYSFFKLHITVNIIIPENAKYLNNIESILVNVGCSKNMYKYIYENNYDNKYNTFQNIKYIETEHCSELISYSIIFNTKNGLIYYSGDTKNTKVLKSLIESNNIIDKIYVETTTDNYPGNVHLYIGDLKEVISSNLINHVYCMHLNSDECIKQAIEYGFNVVKI